MVVEDRDAGGGHATCARVVMAEAVGVVAVLDAVPDVMAFRWWVAEVAAGRCLVAEDRDAGYCVDADLPCCQSWFGDKRCRDRRTLA